MTPRSRKPVIIGAMLGLSNENYRKNFLSLPEVDDELLNRSKDLSPINASLYKSKSESDLLDLKSANEEGILGSAVDKDTPDETLSTPFRYQSTPHVFFALSFFFIFLLFNAGNI